MPLRKIAAWRTPPAARYGELLQERRDRRLGARFLAARHSGHGGASQEGQCRFGRSPPGEPRQPRAMVSFYRGGAKVASGHAFSLRAIASAEARRRKGRAASGDRRPENPASRALW